MKLNEVVNESAVHYTTQPTRRFRVSDVYSFEVLKEHSKVLEHSGPNTTVFDVSNEERVRLAPGDNKWNAMRALYGQDDDEIVCAYAGSGSWICLAINVAI